MFCFSGHTVATGWRGLVLYFLCLNSLLAPLLPALFCSAVTLPSIISLSSAPSPDEEKYFSVSMTIKVGKQKVAWKGIFICARHPLDDCGLLGLLSSSLNNAALHCYLPGQHISPGTSPSTARDPPGLCVICKHFLLYIPTFRMFCV